MLKINKYFFAVLLLLIQTGCIRLVGSAGYSYQGAGDEALKTKQMSLDTDRLIPGKTQGSDPDIEIPAT